MAITTWEGVNVAMQSAAATAITATGITNASPAVLSHGGSDPSNGDYVLVMAEGMNEVDARVFRVANAGVGSFELEGEDSSSYGAFTSGSFSVLTFGTSIGTIKSISPSGGDFEFIDTTTIHDRVRKQIPGVASAISFSLENNWDPSDTGLAAMKAASQNKAQKAFKFVFSNGAICTFYGYVGHTAVPTGETLGQVTTPATITVDGSVTNYAS